MGDEVVVEGGGAGVHGVRGADGYGEGVYAGGGDEFDGFVGVGADAGGVCAVLAADFAEFGFDVHVAVVTPAGDVGGGGEVGGVVEGGAVVHDRADAEIYCGADQFGGGGVVEVDGDVGAAVRGDAQAGQGQRGEAAVIVRGVLRKLQHDRSFRRLGGGGDGLGMFEGDHVERAEPAGSGGGDQCGNGCQRHSEIS
ncbi:hypothetical protein NONI108955_22845 [Nocardia ninae]